MKKSYQKPEIEIVQLRQPDLICCSGKLPSNGKDDGYGIAGSRRRRNSIFDDDEEDDY